MMMIHEDFIKSQQDCADMLGMTLEEYENFCNNIKVNTIDEEKEPYDNSQLYNKNNKED